MNQFTVLLIVCGLVISGCSETTDNTYRESSEARNVPTLHLVVDGIRSAQSQISGPLVERAVYLSCHVQSDRPVELDTFVLVDVDPRLVDEQALTLQWSDFTVILAGETQSEALEYESGILLTGTLDTVIGIEDAVPKVVVTLPPAHERAKKLPTRVQYTDAAGREVKRDLLVEYPFNLYNIGSPTEIRGQWKEQ